MSGTESRAEAYTKTVRSMQQEIMDGLKSSMKEYLGQLIENSTKAIENCKSEIERQTIEMYRVEGFRSGLYHMLEEIISGRFGAEGDAPKTEEEGSSPKEDNL